MPEKETFNQKDIDDAKTIADKFQLQTQTLRHDRSARRLLQGIPIIRRRPTGSAKETSKHEPAWFILYYYANNQKRIVCGTSDKSETMMGYFTKWGDAAADITPIIDLYKTQVRRLAVHLGIPKELALKPSTPALWPNQFAEAELEIKYETLDLILYGLERFMKPEEIAEQLSIDQAIVRSGSSKNTVKRA